MNIFWILYILLAFVLSFATTAGLMPSLLRLCRRRGIYDIPDARKVHHQNIPRMGGILFIPSMLIGVCSAMAIGIKDAPEALTMTSLFVTIGMFLIYLIGLLDDLFGIKAGIKFAIQFVVSLFLPLCGLYIHNLYGLFGLYELPIWVGYPLTVFVSLLIVNAINLIDGIDGLASSLSMIAITVFGLLFLKNELYFYSLYSFALVGSVAAFFLYNMFGKVERGTKTFMGDTGSLSLGYALTFLAVRYVMTNGNPTPLWNCPTALLVPFTLLIVPCFDLVRVALMRFKRGFPIFSPDKSHLHHKCMQAGFSMHLTLLLIVGLQIGFGLFNWVLVLAKASTSVVVTSDVVIYILFILWLNFKKKRLAQTSSKAHE